MKNSDILSIDTLPVAGSAFGSSFGSSFGSFGSSFGSDVDSKANTPPVSETVVTAVANSAADPAADSAFESSVDPAFGYPAADPAFGYPKDPKEDPKAESAQNIPKKTRMENFFKYIVSSTKNSSNRNRIHSNAERLYNHIIADHKDTLTLAAFHSKDNAFLFMYKLGAEWQGIPVYEYLFPSGELLERFNEFDIKSVFDQLQDFFDPFRVTHQIYHVVDGVKVYVAPLELSSSDIEVLLHCDHTDSRKKGKYVCAIVVSWNI